jgi:hypothetical protein
VTGEGEAEDRVTEAGDDIKHADTEDTKVEEPVSSG